MSGPYVTRCSRDDAFACLLQAMMLRQAAATAQSDAKKAEQAAAEHEDAYQVFQRHSEGDAIMRELLDKQGAGLQACVLASQQAADAAAALSAGREAAVAAEVYATSLQQIHAALAVKLAECLARVSRLSAEGRAQDAAAARTHAEGLQGEEAAAKAASETALQHAAELQAVLKQREVQAKVAQQEASLLQQVRDLLSPPMAACSS